MIAGIFHQGSGIGNQLHRYVAARVLALDKGYEFGMKDAHLFKGYFMSLDMGKPYIPAPHTGLFLEERINHPSGADIRPYDTKIHQVEDDTLIDGEFQDERYFAHRLDEVREWLRVETLKLPDDLCIIAFRGGEYVGVPELFLPREYWERAISFMKFLHPGIRFEVHTDDVSTARHFFPYPCIHDPALNWCSIRYAKHLILSNSSFGILPALLGEAQEILAPKYWAGYNVGFWKLPQNEYKRFTYL